MYMYVLSMQHNSVDYMCCGFFTGMSEFSISSEKLYKWLLIDDK